MGFWDQFKERYNRGTPRPQPGDWQAMEAMIEKQPALQPYGYRFSSWRRLLLLLLLLFSSGTGPERETAAPRQHRLAPITDPQRPTENQVKAPPVSTAPDISPTSRSPEVVEKEARRTAPPQAPAQKPQNPSAKIFQKVASRPGKERPQAKPKAPPRPSPRAIQPDEAARLPHLPISLPSLARTPYAALPALLKTRPSRLPDSLARWENPAFNRGKPLAQWSMGWEAQWEIGTRNAFQRWTQGPLLRYRRGSWSVQTGWMQGQGPVQVNQDFLRQSLRVDSSRQFEVTLRLERQVQRYWVVDSFFQGRYQYDTIFRLRQDTVLTWRRDTTRVQTTITRTEKVQLQYQSLPLLAGYHWDWGRWELLLQGGTRLEHWRYTGREGSKNDYWQLSAQLKPQLLYHLSSHWQLGVGAGWSQPLGRLSEQALTRDPAGQFTVQLLYHW